MYTIKHYPEIDIKMPDGRSINVKVESDRGGTVTLNDESLVRRGYVYELRYQFSIDSEGASHLSKGMPFDKAYVGKSEIQKFVGLFTDTDRKWDAFFESIHAAVKDALINFHADHADLFRQAKSIGLENQRSTYLDKIEGLENLKMYWVKTVAEIDTELAKLAEEKNDEPASSPAP